MTRRNFVVPVVALIAFVVIYINSPLAVAVRNSPRPVQILVLGTALAAALAVAVVAFSLWLAWQQEKRSHANTSTQLALRGAKIVDMLAEAAEWNRMREDIATLLMLASRAQLGNHNYDAAKVCATAAVRLLPTSAPANKLLRDAEAAAEAREYWHHPCPGCGRPLTFHKDEISPCGGCNWKGTRTEAAEQNDIHRYITKAPTLYDRKIILPLLDDDDASNIEKKPFYNPNPYLRKPTTDYLGALNADGLETKRFIGALPESVCPYCGEALTDTGEMKAGFSVGRCGKCNESFLIDAVDKSAVGLAEKPPPDATGGGAA